MTSNIAYQTEEIARYFSQNRVSWPQFYESERVIIAQLNPAPGHDILDIGCGCGGLGLALRDQFAVTQYTGVEINPSAAKAAREMNPEANVLEGDILKLSQSKLAGKTFDVVFSLSCVDWNVEFTRMLAAAWAHVAPGGHLVATFRLTDGDGCNDLQRSYQYINYDSVREGECASYVVLNAGALVKQLATFDPVEVNAFGYWGQPSVTAVTPYQKLCFAAFSLQKSKVTVSEATRFQLDLPAEILDAIAHVVPMDD
ncbi:MAG: class I SAM-dependent methyltransferase [Undibacterium sp.]|uniref:class I SAM-dependent methyltransferase n=1 Tax=Undibacterium sp. TaxID=1914977 RepID=UPI002724546A|nr:class I SAM-dependent methyltransferase [Undibacterium sp.]MDO8652911.1 class I SAM-dependent methyltransferase [Undibacterium sp.]